MTVAYGPGDYYANANARRFLKRRREGRAGVIARHNRLVGYCFGRLTVISRFAGEMWVCRCECGRETTVYGFNLKSGNTRSCGCLTRAKPKPPRAKRGSPEHRAKLSAAATARWARISKHEKHLNASW